MFILFNKVKRKSLKQRSKEPCLQTETTGFMGNVLSICRIMSPTVLLVLDEATNGFILIIHEDEMVNERVLRGPCSGPCSVFDQIPSQQDRGMCVQFAVYP